MPLPVTFGSLSGSIALDLLDTNFVSVSRRTVMPGTVSGTNDLTWTPQVNNVTIAAFQDYMQLSAIATGTNIGPMTFATGTLATLNVYKDTAFGPRTLSGGEMRSLNAMQMMFDGSLNSGSGGFHFRGGAGAELVGQTLAPTALALVPPGSLGSLGSLNASLNAMLINQVTRAATVSFTLMNANDTQDVAFLLAGAAQGDHVLVVPYSASPIAGVGYTGFIAAAGTVTIRALNVTAATITPTGGTFRVTALRYSN